ncbi:MAG: heavy metal sensor histidine kinase [Zoogloeaceae bacterium]|nr:heavy metal sensor histidine kinase [Zoogloeaceae bacterium]
MALLGHTRLPLSLTTRLALLFALLTASLLIVVGVVMGRAVEEHFHELDDHELSGKLSLIENLIRRANTPQAREALPQRLDDAFVGHDMVAVLMRDEEGSVIYALQAGRFDLEQIEGMPLPPPPAIWQRDARQFIGREAVFELPGVEGGVQTPVRVLLGLDISHHAHFLTELRTQLWVGISFSALAAALFGWLAAYKGLTPLRNVTAAARDLSAEQLGVRLVKGDAPAEVHDLVEALNGMLDRLESSFQRLRDFSADIAHELRTPVSNLMTQTSVALSQKRSPEEYREVLGSNLEEFERIARMVGDMLLLAQTENSRLPQKPELVVLADEARALAEFYEALADEKGIRLQVCGEARVRGDRLMLRRAVSNLLSNALRHTAAGGVVEIEIAEAGGWATLAVRNPGDTIAPDQLARIFERFHRASPERHRHGEGAGLGLAITRSIVEAHGGRVSAESATGRTRFCIALPAAGTAPAGST